MPTPFIKKVAKETGRSVESVEKDWERAKHISKDPENFAKITAIFKNIVGLKEGLTCSFKEMMFTEE
jgi:hypothetical protein